MQTGKSLIERGTKRPHSAAASDLPARHTRLFASSSVKVKKKPEEFISGLPTGLLEDVIFSFLGLERVKLFQLNKTLKERFDGNSSIKPALVKELLLTLVKAFQIPNPEYSLDQAILLLNGTLKLTKLNPMEYHLAQVMFGTRPSGTVQIKKDILMQAFQDPRNLALAKTILLALIHAHQHLKAAYLGCLFFELSKSEQDVPEDWLDFPFALMVSGKQEAAENWIRTYPHFVKLKGRVVDRDGAIYKGITLYQYTLCLKHTQMRLMLRQYLSLEEAALQASEYESGQNRDMQALKLKYEELMKKTYQAYQYYLDHCNSWTDLQEKDYWIRVIGRLQREWPVHWMQELCREGFNGETEFSSHHALPVAKYYNIDNEIDELVELYPLRQGYLNAKLELRRGSGYELLGKRLISHDFLCLIQEGEDYYVYGPKLTGHIDAAVKWEWVKLDVTLLADILRALPFTEKGNIIHYNPALRPVFDAVDRALGRGVLGCGHSFGFAIGVEGQQEDLRVSVPTKQGVSTDLIGLKRLYEVRSQELAQELNFMKRYLPQNEAEVRLHCQSVSFR